MKITAAFIALYSMSSPHALQNYYQIISQLCMSTIITRISSAKIGSSSYCRISNVLCIPRLCIADASNDSKEAVFRNLQLRDWNLKQRCLSGRSRRNDDRKTNLTCCTVVTPFIACSYVCHRVDFIGNSMYMSSRVECDC